ncbi:sensor histidine kinase [Pseudoalteromonas luteoviolacea]|uniref:ATP-binding protein n=1 Tax=Pseudoalteromonas luteoviolacea TaxID=43657 RepID=UPI001B37129E|nr:ATP-binding protein [Pseudoalteromonas luteoviolacea]MBQ4875813.1 sensor histidine kinase [Pseudoalteromonas luteoviolacea]MBQ4904848.1 sensor histidine kinase [Pseudoalteromonas luteoviolacea]
MVIAFSPQSALGQLLLLRSIAIVLQLVLVLISILLLDKSIPHQPVFSVIALESLFQLISIVMYRRSREISERAMTLQLMADIVFLSVLLSFLGGASNAFVSLLLLPCIIAAVTVSIGYVLFVSASALAAYGYLYVAVTMPMHHHGMHMGEHLLGMFVNFVFMVVVTVGVVAILVKRIREREALLAKTREKQLQQEQLLALGSAAAQVTHQLATPIAHLNLLLEELQEDFPAHPAVAEMNGPILQCRTQLDSFREQTELLKLKRQEKSQSTQFVLEQLEELMTLQYPGQSLTVFEKTSSVDINGDPMLVPSLLNLIVNAAKANERAGKNQIELNAFSEAGKWHFTIRDQGKGIAQKKLDDIGKSVVESDTGFGMALLLTHATLERVNGELHLENLSEGGVLSTAVLPIVGEL